MIHINLMPQKKGRVSKKTVVFNKFLIATGAGVGGVVLLGLMVGMAMSGKVSSLESQKALKTTELEKLKSRAAEIENFEKDRKLFQEKIEVIRKLKRNQSLPVRFLDQLIHYLPDRVWLVDFKDTGGQATLHGRALSNSDIVAMINQMRAMPLLQDIQLRESKREKVENSYIYDFILTARIGSPAPPTGADDAQKPGTPAKKS